MSNGDRTRDGRIHSPELYQLSYTHQIGASPRNHNKLPLFFKMVKRHRTGDRSAFGRAKRQGGVPERSAGPSDPQAKSVPGRKNSSIDEPSLAWRTNRSFVFTRCSFLASRTLMPCARKIPSRNCTALSEDMAPSFPESYGTREGPQARRSSLLRRIQKDCNPDRKLPRRSFIV